jgi:hypothetical protein
MIEGERIDEGAERSGVEYEQNRTKNRTLRPRMTRRRGKRITM